jgi:hypothetical protein
MIAVRARFGGASPVLLLAGGNWNNALNAGPGYRNANNTVTNSNRNIGTHLELRSRLSGPEQRTDPNLTIVGGGGVKHTTNPLDSVSIHNLVERSILQAGPGWSS